MFYIKKIKKSSEFMGIYLILCTEGSILLNNTPISFNIFCIKKHDIEIFLIKNEK